MAAFAILFSLWSLVLSQDSKACVGDQCELKSGSEDETALVQVNVGQSSVKSDLLPAPVLADEGESCLAKCGGACVVLGGGAPTDVILDNLAQANFGQTCNRPFGFVGDTSGAPYLDRRFGGTRCTRSFPSRQGSPCNAASPSGTRRVCQCGSVSAQNQGDPHIQTFRGAHYTLLQPGIFVAWNFSKPAPSAAPAEWQLLAAYAGNSFTTQGLLLLDRHSGQSMEITAEDCSWRVKEKTSPWRKAQVEMLSAEDGTTSLQVKKLHEKIGETKMLRSAILLQMESGSDMKNIGKLAVHCGPQNRLDFKMSIFDRKDVEYVGGELGVAPDANRNYHFLFSKKSMVQMRADQEFKAPGSWVTLGGSPAGAAYLEKKQNKGVSLMQSQSCSDAEEESARAVCSKHLDEETHPETFSDCLFDLCHGGDESFAQSAAAFLMPLDDSSA